MNGIHKVSALWPKFPSTISSNFFIGNLFYDRNFYSLVFESKRLFNDQASAHVYLFKKKLSNKTDFSWHQCDSSCSLCVKVNTSRCKKFPFIYHNQQNEWDRLTSPKKRHQWQAMSYSHWCLAQLESVRKISKAICERTVTLSFGNNIKPMEVWTGGTHKSVPKMMASFMGP